MYKVKKVIYLYLSIKVYKKKKPTQKIRYTYYFLDNICIISRPPYLWAKETTDYPRTTNGTESFHNSYNPQL